METVLNCSYCKKPVGKLVMDDHASFERDNFKFVGFTSQLTFMHGVMCEECRDKRADERDEERRNEKS